MIFLKFVQDHVVLCIIISVVVSAVLDFVKMKVSGKGGLISFAVFLVCALISVFVMNLIPVNLTEEKVADTTSVSISESKTVSVIDADTDRTQMVEKEKEEKEKAFYEGYADIIDEINSGFADVGIEFSLEQLTEFGMFLNGDIATLSEDTYDIFWNALVNNKQDNDAVNKVRNYSIDYSTKWDTGIETKEYTLSFEPLAKLIISNDEQRLVRYMAREHDRILRLVFSDVPDRDKVDAMDEYAIILYKMLYKGEGFEDGDSGQYVGFSENHSDRVKAFAYCFMNIHIIDYIISPDGGNRKGDTKLQLYANLPEMGEMSISELHDVLMDKFGEMMRAIYGPSHHFPDYR